jgi:hypothetical protein
VGGAFAAQLAVESTALVGDLFVSLIGEAALYVYRASDAALEPIGGGEIVTHPTYRALFAVGYEL